MDIVAHRGLRLSYPENTLYALESALKLGISVEFDVELTEDDALVIVHQETLLPDWDKECLKKAPPCCNRRWVNSNKLSKIKRLDAGKWFSQKFAGVYIPEFKEVAMVVDQYLRLNQGVSLYIEIKDPFFWEKRNIEYEERISLKVIQEINSYLKHCIDNIFILSFNYHIIRHINCIAPRIKTCFLLSYSEMELLGIKEIKVLEQEINHRSNGLKLFGVILSLGFYKMLKGDIGRFKNQFQQLGFYQNRDLHIQKSLQLVADLKKYGANLAIWDLSEEHINLLKSVL